MAGALGAVLRRNIAKSARNFKEVESHSAVAGDHGGKFLIKFSALPCLVFSKSYNKLTQLIHS